MRDRENQINLNNHLFLNSSFFHFFVVDRFNVAAHWLANSRFIRFGGRGRWLAQIAHFIAHFFIVETAFGTEMELDFAATILPHIHNLRQLSVLATQREWSNEEMHLEEGKVGFWIVLFGNGDWSTHFVLIFNFLERELFWGIFFQIW